MKSFKLSLPFPKDVKCNINHGNTGVFLSLAFCHKFRIAKLLFMEFLMKLPQPVFSDYIFMRLLLFLVDDADDDIDDFPTSRVDNLQLNSENGQRERGEFLCVEPCVPEGA